MRKTIATIACLLIAFISQAQAQFGPTTGPSLLNTVNTFTGLNTFTNAGGIVFNPAGGSPWALLNNNTNGGTTAPVPTFYPTTANLPAAVDISPNGSPADFFGYGNAWNDICNTDQIVSGASPGNCLHLSARTSFMEVSAVEYHSGSLMPLELGMRSDGVFTASQVLNTDGSTTFDGNIAFSPTTKGIKGTTTNDIAPAGNVGEIIASIGQDQATGTIGFTNGSAVITDAAACAAGATTGCVGIGNVMTLTTSGGLPTNFSTATAYYISATNFVAGTSYELATTPTGTPIVAGSAGTGTQTRNSTIANSNGNPLTVASVALTAGQWSCSGSATHTFTSATTTRQETFIGTTNNSLTGLIPEANNQLAYGTTTLTESTKQNTGSIPLKLSGSTQYYLEIDDAFSAGTGTASGSLICTRVR